MIGDTRNTHEVAHGGAEVARLILEHSNLPVMKMGGDGTGEDLDRFVLELHSAWLGEWWSTGETVFDDEDDALEWCEEHWGEEGDPSLPSDLPHGRCIWVRMDYWREGSGSDDDQ